MATNLNKVVNTTYGSTTIERLALPLNDVWKTTTPNYFTWRNTFHLDHYAGVKSMLALPLTLWFQK